jgi:hypothetical protein
MGMEVRIMNTTVTEASTHTSPDGNTAGSGNANNGNGNFGHNGNGKLVFTFFLSPWDIEVTGRREYMILSLASRVQTGSRTSCSSLMIRLY